MTSTFLGRNARACFFSCDRTGSFRAQAHQIFATFTVIITYIYIYPLKNGSLAHHLLRTTGPWKWDIMEKWESEIIAVSYLAEEYGHRCRLVPQGRRGRRAAAGWNRESWRIERKGVSTSCNNSRTRKARWEPPERPAVRSRAPVDIVHMRKFGQTWFRMIIQICFKQVVWSRVETLCNDPKALSGTMYSTRKKQGSYHHLV